MVIFRTYNQTDKGFDVEVHIEGPDDYVRQECTAFFDYLYKKEPKMFEQILLSCKYTEDHT